ncbi:MAG: HIT domain-containing protein [Verrucomicrobiales bacterium]
MLPSPTSANPLPQTRSLQLHPRLEKGSHPLYLVSGCHLRLKDNASFPWLLIIPEIEEGIEDLHQLSPERYAEIVFVIRAASNFVDDHFQPEKLNVACIGNIVRQMHIHIVGRSGSDSA